MLKVKGIMNILVVDDEQTILDGVEEYLREEGYNVFTAKDGTEAVEVFKETEINLIVLDLMLPERSGFEVLEEIRTESNIPVIILSAMEDEISQLKGFDMEADDYVTKPFSLPLLSKRINALLKRHYGNHEIWRYREAVVDFTSYKAVYLDKEADIKPKEIDVLKFLLQHSNQAVSREQILEYVWDRSAEIPYDRVIDVYVKNLRKKLGLDCIVTVKNVGYKLSL
ncbi:response regulator transcription factor [Gemella cuniculi]